MSEQGSTESRAGSVDPSRTDPDRAWWAEPDPVDLFASGLELAIRQLHVEVAGLRAERDGLRLEVEGLRAKLSIAQEQLASRDGLAETVRQLQAVVARLTLRGDLVLAPDPSAAAEPPAVEPPAIADLRSPVVLPETPVVTPFPAPVAMAPPVVAPVVTPDPVPVAPAPAPAELSAVEQLKAMGVWPPKAGVTVPTPPPPPPITDRAFAPPPRVETPAPRIVPERTPEPEPEREPVAPRATEREPIVSWDRLSTRRTPVVTSDDADVDDEIDADGPKPKSTAQRILVRAGSVVGAIVIFLVLAVTIGPRFLPYQTYFVRSGSMRPTIDVGAMVVLTKTDANSLQVGDIITFDNPDKPGTLVTHRIAGIEQNDTGRVFTTKGDANAVNDSWQVPATGDGWKYAFDVPYLGFAFGYLGTPQARLALLAVPGVILGFLTLMDIWKPDDASQKKGKKRSSARGRR